MSFKKGKSGNPEGRPAGSKNKTTEEIRERINLFLSENWSQVMTDFKKLDPERKLFFYEKLLKYSVAPLQSITMQADLREMDCQTVEHHWIVKYPPEKESEI